MKRTLLGLALIAATSSAHAFNFFDNNNGEWKTGPYGPYYEASNWPQWTPMYWMEEMMDSFDNNNNAYGGNGFNMPFFGNNNNNINPYAMGMPMQPGRMPMQQPYPMMPQQGMMPAPNMAPIPAPQAVAPKTTTAPGPAANKAQ